MLYIVEVLIIMKGYITFIKKIYNNLYHLEKNVFYLFL